ncbi:hypothetical protein R5R35_001779 [Gryllus longicercus]|uniref:Ion transport domain-containing protein n=1 Tax=Gryllus longicercus TaxID=2509291 RepID=A0AAN9WEG1_9ORTH
MAGDGQETPQDKSLQDQLLDALLQGELQDFRRLLAHPRVNPNHRYGKPHFGTCLELACRQRGRHEFVRELLSKVKPNINKIFPEPLHYAAGRGNAGALELLLHDKRTRVNAQDSAGRTALHYVAKSFPAGEESADYERCLALLLAHPDVDANRANHKGFTPIHEAALQAGKHAVQAFLLHAKQDLDLDSARGHGRTARQAIVERFPELKNSLPENQKDITCGRRDPQSRLIVELQERNLENFCQLLLQVDTEGSIVADPNYQYGKPINATCLELASKEQDSEEFIKALLRAGADPNVVNPLTEKSPIHVASENANAGALKILIDHKTTNINSTDSHGRTALHYIASRRIGEDRDQDCLSMLLAHPDVNINIADNDGVTPILSAALADNKACVETMLKLKAEFLDLHNVKLNGEKTVWNVITEIYPDLSHLLPNYSYSVYALQPTVHSQLIQHLHKRQTKEFIEKITLHNRENEYVNDGDGSYTFLQYACKHGLHDVVEILLKNGADPNQTLENNRWPPIVISCSRRHHNILMLFLNLPSNRKLDIDATDMKGNTALHYAAKHGDLNSVLALLSHGANIEVKNIFDKPPLPAKAVENLLNQCLKADGKHYPEEDDYKVLFDYEILVPNKIQTSTEKVTKNDDLPLTELTVEDECEIVIPKSSFCQLNAEMEFLFYLSKSEEHRYLLKHPIITSFLLLKWYRVRFSFYVNLMFYTLYVIFLNAYILVEVENAENDQDLLMNLANGSLPVRTQFLLISLTILLSYLLIRELVQFIMCPGQYIKNAENLLDWSLIILTSLTLFVKISNSDWRKSVTVMTVLLSWAELVLVTGRLPRLSRNIQMLKTVSWTFLRFLIWYSLLIISFGISFYTLFHDARVDKEGENIFEDLGRALFKTFIMMTGEFNSDDKIPFKSTNVTGHILFMLFVFLIAIVLLNLLTGLAVSDTQAIQNNADILSVISRIRLVYEIESMMLGWHHKIFLLGIFRPFAYRLENWVKAISLFPPSVHSKHVCVLPNKGNNIITPHEDGVKCKMDVEILGAAMNIIGSRNRATDIDLIKNRLDAIEKCQSANSQILNVILTKLDEIQTK